MPIYIVITKGRENYFVYRVEAEFGKAEEVLKDSELLLDHEEIVDSIVIGETKEEPRKVFITDREPRILTVLEFK